MDFDVAIIGAGAAGLMCAIEAGKRGRRVLVIDHANRAGKKILMSGGGRCNFTNLHCESGNFLSANPHFCKSALARYTQWDFIAMVERHGIAHHEKELGQLFCDDSSKQIVQMLLAECSEANVRIELNSEVENVDRHAGNFSLRTSTGLVTASSLVVATGGLSIPKMGASGFGYGLAKQFGLRVLPTRAALVPLTLSGTHLDRYAGLSGLALPVETHCNGISFAAGLLFTHRGLSGPAILQISSYWQPGDDLRLNLAVGHSAFDYLSTQQQSRPSIELKTALAEMLPKRLAQRLCETAFGSLPLRQYRETQLHDIAEQLHRWPMVASGTEGYRTAEVTLGGVDTEELSSSTMQSRKVPGLYFIGEVVDVTGHLGGYNFQWAWASGAAAGHAV